MPSVHPDKGRDQAEHAELKTREAVVEALLAEGPATAGTLATRLGISAAGIRRHLDQLLAEGAVITREAHAAGPRGRGRPAKAYLLTETGRSRLPHSYDDIAVQALEFLAESAGPEAVEAFARRRAEALVEPYLADLAATEDLHERVEILSRALTAGGFAASVERVGVGEQLCQHHCPVATVAGRFPQLCEAEFAVLSEALGSYAQRLATIARGDSFCTTFIPVGAAGLTVRAGSGGTDGASPAAGAPHARTARPTAASAPTEQGRTTS
ncbi:HTH domain-containing protein [Nakamurella sp. YIM 132087]|uniref:HTH domain-containing protein n=1 Tax=Nakamurella alba TaxID=2665158 RepID=A0A7K1FK18_9ACTN|nr:HTH domain-containing protein [Nakamurella alba]